MRQAPHVSRHAQLPAAFTVANIADNIFLWVHAATRILAAVVTDESVATAIAALLPIHRRATPGALAIPITAIVRRVDSNNGITHTQILGGIGNC